MNRTATLTALTLALATIALGAIGTQAAAPVTVQYGTWDATREKADRKLIAAFEKTHPDIKIKYNLVPWDTYWQKAAAMTAGGATFDVMWMNLDNFPFYASQGALEGIPLSAQDKAAYPAASINPYLNDAGNTTYGLPLGPQAVSIFINRSLFKERGVPIPTKAWTWDDLMAAAKKLRFDKNGKKYWGINGQDLQADLEYGMSFYYTFGGNAIIKKNGNTWQANLDDTFRNTAKKLHGLVFTDKVAPGTKDTTQAGYQLFQAGQLGIYVEGTWMTSVLNETPKLDWAFAPFPTLAKGQTPKPVFSAHALAIPKAAKQKSAAQVFARYATNDKAASTLLANNTLFPTQADPYSKLYLKSLPNRNGEVILAQLKNSVVINSGLQRISNLPEVLTALNSALNLAWTGNQPLDKAIDKASADMNKLLKDSEQLELK